MDGERFDDLIKGLCTKRLTRLSALRGLAAGAVAAVAGVTLSAGTDAAKKQVSAEAKKKKWVCHCDDASSTYRDLKLRGKNVKKKLGQHKRHTLDYVGKCKAPRPAGSSCGAVRTIVVPGGTQPIAGCTLDTDCPANLPFCRNRECVECIRNGDCPEGEFCNANGQCEPAECTPACVAGETCLPNDVCCPDNRVCGDVCLTEGQECCAGVLPCDGQCVGSNDEICCPDNRVCGDACLVQGQVCCNNVPCTGTCPSNTCVPAECNPACGAGTTCINGACCQNDAMCGTGDSRVCCAGGAGFCQGGQCKPAEVCEAQRSKQFCEGQQGHSSKCCPSQNRPDDCVLSVSGAVTCRVE